MKTIISLLIFLITLSASTYGGKFEVGLADEAYINDIPFNTAEVLLGVPPCKIQAFQLSEEKYINDIPFDTRKIAHECLFNNGCFKFDESYINDIPFNTEMVYSNVITDNMIAEISNENYVDDIPFSTYEIAVNSILEKKILDDFKNEKLILDIPFNTFSIAYNQHFEAILENFINEHSIDDIPFETSEIYCVFQPCKKNCYIGFTPEISNVKYIYPKELEVKHIEPLKYPVQLNEMIKTLDGVKVSNKYLDENSMIIELSVDSL